MSAKLFLTIRWKICFLISFFSVNLCFYQQAEIRKLMRQLERDKIELQGQLRDLEWRLDNESKVSQGRFLSLAPCNVIM